MIKISESAKQIRKAFDRLPSKEKLKLSDEFNRKTRKERWNELFNIIDKRLKKFPITQKEIDQEIERGRKEHYAKRRG